MTSNIEKNVATELEALIRQGQPTEDWSGRTPLMLLADELASLPPNDARKREYGWAVSQMARQIPSFTDSEMERLCFFIESAEISVDLFSEAFRAVLRSGLKSAREIRKRAELLRLLAEMGVSLAPSLLREEKPVKRRFPWHWIDAMEPVNWPEAERAITETLSAEREARNLLARLPYLWEKHSRVLGSCLSDW
ncbi:MAG: hypothetical protein MUF81_19700, partial [Verrucomicrobia bacterium]|nr:hypothetical protein [Verrucomicrobiota bacterium]